MTAREIRQQITSVDRELATLEAWHATLVSARKQWLLDDSQRAREAIAEIDHGVGRGHGHSTGLSALDDGFHHGRLETEAMIARLRERRVVLSELQPPAAQVERDRQEAERQAVEIRTLAATLGPRAESLRESLKEVTREAVAIAEDFYRVFTDNARLDGFCRDADVARPVTPRVDAPTVDLSLPLGELLATHFTGGSPSPVDASCSRDALAKGPGGWNAA